MEPWLGFGSKADLNITLTVIPVTNLNDSGPGSLRLALTDPRPRLVVFNVGGRIKLSSDIVIKTPKLFVAGQTSPAPITVSNWAIRVESHDIILQHLELRVGDDTQGAPYDQRRSLTIAYPAYNVIVDHCSISWAIDENLNTYGKVHDISITNCIISEALNHSKHSEGPHSCGALVNEGGKNISFIRNLFAHNKDRNIRVKYDTSGEFVNNLVYNWGDSNWNTFNPTDSENKAKPTIWDLIGNSYHPGKNSYTNSFGLWGEKKAASKGSKFYLTDNIGPTRKAILPEWSFSNLPEATYGKKVQLTGGIASTDMWPSAGLETRLLGVVGSRPWARNAVDSRVLNEVNTITGTLKNTVAEAGGYPLIIKLPDPVWPSEVPGAGVRQSLTVYEK